MIDFYAKESMIYKEMDAENQEYWLDYRQRKFLHNIDTFYYSVKLKNDCSRKSKDVAVKKFRNYFAARLRDIKADECCYNSLSFYLLGMKTNLNLKPFHYAYFYSVMLECPDYFDIFVATTTPASQEGDESVTPEFIVQIRSYMLWIYGVQKCFEMSYEYIEKICDYFGLEVAYTLENRLDYCWHSNYIQSPDKYFNDVNYHKMKVTRLGNGKTTKITSSVGSEDFEVDYIAVGKRSDKIFLRIYHKSKEVIEKNYKPWFFKVWLFNGLINRYDFYVYEKCFLKRSWKYVDLARLEFYLEFGSDEHYKNVCRELLEGDITKARDNIAKLANILTPKINIVMNVEFQVMRKHSKNYCLIPFKDNSNKGIHKRVYDVFDNRALIVDYLTHDMFRLVQTSEEVADINKSRREDNAFWKALRHTKLVDACAKPEDVKLIREYNRNMSKEVLKLRAMKASVTLGIYNKGLNYDSPIKDCVEALTMMNDNDIQEVRRFKNKKLSQFNEMELAQLSLFDIEPLQYQIVRTDTGEVFTDYSTESEDLQGGDGE